MRNWPLAPALGIVILLAAIGGIAWAVFSPRDYSPITPVGETPNLGELAGELRPIAHDFAEAFPEAVPVIRRLMATLADEATAAAARAEAERQAASAARHATEEKQLRERLATLSAERTRLERIANTQRQVVADIMEESVRAQAKANRYADVKNFVLGILATFCAAWIARLAKAFAAGLRTSGGRRI